VGLFSPELFNKSIGAPSLVFYSASAISITTFPATSCCYTCYSAVEYVNNLDNGCGNIAGDYYGLVVTLVNNGGSGTYGPVAVTFTSGDPLLQFYGTVPPVAGQPSEPYCTAVSQFGSGTEILPGSQTQVPLLEGYEGANNGLIDDSNIFSLQFYYPYNAAQGYTCASCANPTYFPVPINMSISDGLGNRYYQSFDIYIAQNPGGG